MNDVQLVGVNEAEADICSLSQLDGDNPSRSQDAANALYRLRRTAPELLAHGMSWSFPIGSRMRASSSIIAATMSPFSATACWRTTTTPRVDHGVATDVQGEQRAVPYRRGGQRQLVLDDLLSEDRGTSGDAVCSRRCRAIELVSLTPGNVRSAPAAAVADLDKRMLAGSGRC